jgi:hypothetical protein
MKRKVALAMTSSLILLCWSCARTPTAEHARAAEPEPGEEHAHDENHDHGHDHDHDHDGPGPGEIARAESPITGPVTIGEMNIEGALEVDPRDVVASPEAYMGRTVQFTGRVNGYCVHNRGWYSIEAPGAAPPYLRVMVRPDFRVPEGVLDASVETVGVIEAQEFSREMVEHIEVEHGLGTASREVTGDTITLTVVRVRGALFSPRSERVQ